MAPPSRWTAIARPDGSVDYLEMTREGAKLMGDFFARLDTVIMGRKTVEAAERNGEPPSGPWKTYAFSRTRPPGDRNRIVWVNQRPSALIRQLRRRRGKHIFLMGGGELARGFLQEDLIDELFIGIVPILLGAGIPLFPPGFLERRFQLIECKPYDGSSVALKYRRIVKARKRKASR
jgi:dihydrofolate reductase